MQSRPGKNTQLVHLTDGSLVKTTFIFNSNTYSKYFSVHLFEHAFKIQNKCILYKTAVSQMCKLNLFFPGRKYIHRSRANFNAIS